jgi:hypothetical protein
MSKDGALPVCGGYDHGNGGCQARQEQSGPTAFRRDRHGSWGIYTMNTDGAEQTRVFDRRGQDVLPTWHPGGAGQER